MKEIPQEINGLTEKITLETRKHGTFYATTRALDAAIIKYLPASVVELRKEWTRRAGMEEWEYEDVDEVGAFLIMFASADH